MGLKPLSIQGRGLERGQRMTRTIPFGFDTTERAGTLAPVVSVDYSERYLGRPLLLSGGSADDGVATERAALIVRSAQTELIQLQSRGTTIELRALNST